MERFQFYTGTAYIDFDKRDVLLRCAELLIMEGEPVPVDILAKLETHGIIIEEIVNGQG